MDFKVVWRVKPQIPGLEFIAVETWMALGKWYSSEANALAKKHGAKVRVAYDSESQAGDALIVTLYGNAASMTPVIVQAVQDKIANMMFPITSPWLAKVESKTPIKSRGIVEVVVTVDTEVKTIDSIRRQYVLPEMMRMFSKNLPAYLKRVHSGHWDLQSIGPVSANSDAIKVTLKIAKQISESQIALDLDNLESMLNFECPIQVPVSVQAVITVENDSLPIGF
jgi:hypothetical protein